jgi:hypothetical protein
LNGITCLSDFMKMYQSVQKLLLGDTQTGIHTHTQNGDLINLLLFLESRLKINMIKVSAFCHSSPWFCIKLHTYVLMNYYYVYQQ